MKNITEYTKKLNQSYIIAVFNRDKKPLYKDWPTKKLSDAELESAIAQGYYLAVVNPSDTDVWVDFDRGGKKTDNSDIWKELYRDDIVKLCKYFGIGLHESVNGFHIFGGLNPSWLEGLDDVCVTKRTKNQCFILPINRPGEVLVEFSGSKPLISMYDFLYFLYKHQYVDGYLLESGLHSYCQENELDIHEVFMNVFRDEYDKRRTEYMERRDPTKKIRIASVISEVEKKSDFYAHILKRMTPEKKAKYENVEWSIPLDFILRFYRTAKDGLFSTDAESIIKYISSFCDENKVESLNLYHNLYISKDDIKKAAVKLKRPKLMYIHSFFSRKEAVDYFASASHYLKLHKLGERIKSIPRKPSFEAFDAHIRKVFGDLKSIEVRMMYHWFTNLKRTLMYGDEMLMNEQKVRSYLPYRTFLNLLGRQGCGKTTFLNALRDFIGGSDFVASIDASGISDHWLAFATSKKPLMFIDELAALEKADQDQLKKRIDSATIECRRMFSGEHISTPNITNFISGSNKSFGEVLTDTTGARRYMEVCIPSKINIGELLNLNNYQYDGRHHHYFENLFSFIDENDYATYTPVIQEWQELELRNKSPIELFLEQIKRNKSYANDDLFKSYIDFCDTYRIRPMSYIHFCRVLNKNDTIKKIIKNGKAYYMIEGPDEEIQSFVDPFEEIKRVIEQAKE